VRTREQFDYFPAGERYQPNLWTWIGKIHPVTRRKPPAVKSQTIDKQFQPSAIITAVRNRKCAVARRIGTSRKLLERSRIRSSPCGEDQAKPGLIVGFSDSQAASNRSDSP
jgi:hypothetical protein